MSNYKLTIDFENDSLNYTPSSSGHGKSVKLEYADLNETPSLIDNFSARDAYLIGTIFTNKYSNTLRNVIVEPRYKLFIFFSILFVAIMLVSNVLSTKLTTIFGLTIPGAMLIYPFSYILDYIITDVYGYQNARRVILSTIMTLALFDVSVYIMQMLPPSEFWPYQREFDVVFSRMLRTFTASTIAFIFGFFLSSYVLQKAKLRGLSLFKRIFSALLIAEISNTFLFCLIAFYGLWPVEKMVSYIFISYSTKVIYELIMYGLVTKPVINYVKRVEQLDIIDWGTNFTPFSWEVKYTVKNNIYNSSETGNVSSQLI